MADRLVVHPTAVLGGSARVPGDKSVTHRAVLLAAISDGVCEIAGPGTGADNLSTLSAVGQLGVETSFDGPELFTVQGVGLSGLRSPSEPIDCGNSGTTARLLAGLLAGAGVSASLVGDASLSARPMRRIADPLSDLGYAVETGPDGRLPLRVGATAASLSDAPTRAVLRIASAQVKSSILLSGLYRTTATEVVEPAVSRDHTERMLRAMGVRCGSSAHYLRPATYRGADAAPTCRLDPGAAPSARSLEVPGDLSSAAFLIAAALVAGESVEVMSVGVNPTRTGFLDVLGRMGAGIELRRRRILSTGEPAADIRVRRGPLRGTEVSGAEIPLLIDEIPVLCVLAAAAEGVFSVRDAAELRVKESDRIEQTAALLRAMGVRVDTFEDGLDVHGRGTVGWSALDFDCGDDHRIAMSAVIAALAADGPSSLSGTSCIDVSYPDFAETLCALGATIEASA